MFGKGGGTPGSCNEEPGSTQTWSRQGLKFTAAEAGASAAGAAAAEVLLAAGKEKSKVIQASWTKTFRQGVSARGDFLCVFVCFFSTKKKGFEL